MLRALQKVIFFLLISKCAWADDLHYRNILVGEQASGLGGAFVAISDDPSGIFYNPAGIVFGMENYFSLSANSYMHSSRKYVGAIGAQDYNISSSGLVPTFFGMTQSHGKNKWGFAVVVPNQDSFNQDDRIFNISSQVGAANSLKRKFFQQDQSYMIGGAYALEIQKDLTMGISLFGVYRTRNAIDNQLILYNGGRYLSQEVHLDQNTVGTHAKFGLQYMPLPKMSFGATLAKTVTVTSSRKNRTVVIDSGAGTNPTETAVEDNPSLLSPWEMAFGAAYFPSKTSLYTADFMFYTEDKNHTDFPTVHTWNLAMGTEQYLSDSFVVRLGFFTNNANTAAVVSDLSNQLDHVDLYGLTAAFSFRSPGSSVTLGTSYSTGSGQGQAIADSNAVQTVLEQRTAVYLMGSYQF